MTKLISNMCACVCLSAPACRDRKFKQFVDLYAKDEDTFFKVGWWLCVCGGGRCRGSVCVS
jgi:hypothetical protein